MLNRRKVKASILLFKPNTKKGRERYKEDGASEDIKIQQHQLNRHIGKAGQYIRTNSVLCHITLWLTKQPLHEWQRSHRYGSEYAKTRWLLYD